MAEKAILVTNENKNYLQNRFQHDGTGVDVAVGYYLVTHFGDDDDYDMMSAANFKAKYMEGRRLATSGFFEAVPRV